MLWSRSGLAPQLTYMNFGGNHHLIPFRGPYLERLIFELGSLSCSSYYEYMGCDAKYLNKSLPQKSH
jgi:hypothetical protein